MRFLIFTTGGTIASVPTDEGLRPGLSGGQLLRAYPDLMGFDHDIEIIDVLSRDSSDMGPSDWLLLAERIRESAPQGDAAVVLHGTDTMAWTASALSYMLNDVPIPVVLTGSMLTVDEPGSDVGDNIFAAVQFAMQMAMYRRRGVAVAFDGVLIHGPRAMKIDSRRKRAFVSVDYPLLGEMKDRETHKVAWLGRRVPKLSPERPWTSPVLETNVALVPIFPGMDARMLDAVLEARPRAVVLEAFGLGGVPEGLAAAVGRGLDGGIPFVLRTQSSFGGTDPSLYEVGRRVLDLGVLSARDMTREALMVKLMLILPLCAGRDGLERLLGVDLCDEGSGGDVLL